MMRLHLYYTTWDALGKVITDSHGFFRGPTRRMAIEAATSHILDSANESGRTPVSWRIGEVEEPVRWQEPDTCPVPYLNQ